MVVGMDESDKQHHVVVVGGGAAGVSGALTLGRARTSVLVIDAGEQRNRPASGVHGFLHTLGLGQRIEADGTGRTGVPGVWVAGNVADLAATVAGAASAGVLAGAAINNDLVAEDTQVAVERAAALRAVAA
jgi:thioredoxin reductase